MSGVKAMDVWSTLINWSSRCICIMHEDSLYGRPIGIEPRSCSVIYNVKTNNTARTPPLTTARAARAPGLSLGRASLLGLGEHGWCLQDGCRRLGLLTVHAQPLPISGRRPVYRTPDALEDLLDPTNPYRRYRVKVISSCFAAAV